MKNYLVLLLFLAFFPVSLSAQYPYSQPYYYGAPPQGRIGQPYRGPIRTMNYSSVNNNRMQQQAFAERINREESDWTLHMIKEKDRFHDFKTVAKGAKCEHRFEITNPFVERVHIARVTASCACTTPIIENDKDELETYEKTAVIAHFHTEKLNGFKSATITVVIDKPYQAEFQLNIQGNIRTDLTVSPEEVRLDRVKEGTETSRTLSITYTGNNAAWRIVDFSSQNKHLSGEVVGTPTSLPGGGAVWTVKIKLDGSAPKGELNDRIFIKTNDIANRQEIPIMVRGVIGKVLTVTPPTIFLGTLKPGEESGTKDAAIFCAEPFKITKISSDDPNVVVNFKIDPNADAKRVFHFPVKFLNPSKGSEKLDKDGKLLSVIRIETDDPTVKAAFNVTAAVETPDEKVAP